MTNLSFNNIKIAKKITIKMKIIMAVKMPNKWNNLKIIKIMNNPKNNWKKIGSKIWNNKSLILMKHKMNKIIKLK